MCKSPKGRASKGKRTAGGEIQNTSYDGEKESAPMQLEREVSPGELIWIKLRGNLWWPAVVVAEGGVCESSKPGNRLRGEVLVRLYGSYEYLYVDPVKYISAFKMILKKNNNGSCEEIFDKALEQDCLRGKSNEPKRQGSKSTANSRADASKDKNQGNGNEVGDSNPIDITNDKALSERVGETNSKVSKQNGVKRKLGSNEQSTGERADSKISKKDRLVKNLKPDNSHAEENARRSPRWNRSNVEDKSRSRTSAQDEIQKKLKQKSSSIDKQAKNKANEHNSVQKKQRKNNQIVEDGKKHQNPKKDGEPRECKPTRKRAHEATIVQAKGKQVKNKTHKQERVQKKLTNSKRSAEDEEQCKSPKQGSVHSKLKSSSQTPERISPGKPPESSARRKRVMQGLGLIAPPGSPFHKNGPI